MIKTILFDFGGVVVTLTPDTARARFLAIGADAYVNSMNQYTQGGIGGLLEEGKITDEDFRRELGKMCGKELTWEQCEWCWLGYIGEVPQRNLDVLLKLRAEGYRVALLSNTNPFVMRWAMSTGFDGKGNPLPHYFDECYLSYKCGAMKPDPRFFNHVVEKERLNPFEILFLDDGQGNIDAAEKLGIQTMLVENGEDWRDKLISRLAKP